MANIKVVVRANKKRKDGSVPLYLRVTKDRKSSYIATKQYLLEKDWDKEKCLVKKSHPNSTYLNNYLSEKVAELQRSVIKKEISSKHVTSSAIKKDVTVTSTNFFNYSEQLNELRLKNGKISTYKRFKSLNKKIEGFTNTRNFNLGEIDVEWLRLFESHLKSAGNKYSTIGTALRGVRAILYQAIRDGFLEQKENPFFNFSIKSSKAHKEKLSLEEIKKIENLELEKDTLIWHVKNYFLFSFYCAGIRVGDVIFLTKSNIRNGRLEYEMGKTGVEKSILLNKQSLAILSFYAKSSSTYLFPIANEDRDLDNPLVREREKASKSALINKYLKKIADKIETDVHLSFHISRHSFADFARKKKMNVYDISKALGHSSIAITEAYLSSFDETTLDNEMQRIFE